MQVPQEIQSSAFRSSGGELAWRRIDALQAVEVLRSLGAAILGGELWLIRGSDIWGLIPQLDGPPAIYHWETARKPRERWAQYVDRAAFESAEAIKALPGDGEILYFPNSEVYYNLTWIFKQGAYRAA